MSGSAGGGGKLNPKNLLYDRSATLPPFLARLHAQHAPGNFDGPDPILAARRRPTKKPRSGSEEAEDAPLVLDEEGNVVDGVCVGRDGTVMEKPDSRVEGEGDGRGDGSKEGTHEGETIGEEKEGDNKKEAKVGIGASKKRKVGKVIGGDGDDSDHSDQEQNRDDKKPKGETKDKVSGIWEEALGERPKPKTAKNKKTAKKIKLSFGDEEG